MKKLDENLIRQKALELEEVFNSLATKNDTATNDLSRYFKKIIEDAKKGFVIKPIDLGSYLVWYDRSNPRLSTKEYELLINAILSFEIAVDNIEPVQFQKPKSKVDKVRAKRSAEIILKNISLPCFNLFLKNQELMHIFERALSEEIDNSFDIYEKYTEFKDFDYSADELLGDAVANFAAAIEGYHEEDKKIK